jgi:DNA-binding CsgD family transcriptional regulator
VQRHLTPAHAEHRIGAPLVVSAVDAVRGGLHEGVRLDGQEAPAAQVSVAPGVPGADRGGVEGGLEPAGLPVRANVERPPAEAGRLAAQLAGDRDDPDSLTGREREVAALLAEALSNRQIAARPVLSERTVESHVRSILAKTQCANRTEFVARRTLP